MKMQITEIFTSIQGEGRYIGRPQIFIRLAGCNMDCIWCDSRHSHEKGVEMDVAEVLSEVASHKLKSICITGGEPMLQKMELLKLVHYLNSNNFEIVLETNGSIYDENIFNLIDCVSMDAKPPSSKMKSEIDYIKKLCVKDQVKIVIKDDGDFEFAKKILDLSPCEVCVQPVDGQNLKWLAEKVLDCGLDFRVLPQLHKILGVK